ncbi:MAG: HEAT repeat domain-containing protein [Cyclobacteriaceae bacterium]
MKKEKALELWQDKIAGEISENDEKALETFLKANPELASEWGDLEQTWMLFDEIDRPAPSTQMDARFDGMLAAYQSAKKQSSAPFLDGIVSWLTRSWQVALASMVLGLFIGWWMLPSQNQTQSISQLSSEIQDMKKLMMLTLIEQPKAQERIRAVNMVSELPSADEKVIEALITTLNMDDNLNVRLASLEALLNYGKVPEVRGALIDALKVQNSAIMLVAIADALVTIQETSSVEAMEQLRDTVKDELVKDKLTESIKSLSSI